VCVFWVFVVGRRGGGGGGFNPSSVCQRFLFKYLYTVPRLVSGIYISKSYKNK